MKRKFTNSILLLLIAILCFSLVACDSNSDSNNQDNTEEISPAIFTVQYDTDGGSGISFEDGTILDSNPSNPTICTIKVKTGDTAPEPIDIPIKKPYNFKYWAIRGTSTRYSFDLPVTDNLNLIAIYDTPKIPFELKADSNYPGPTIEDGYKLTEIKDVELNYNSAFDIPIQAIIKKDADVTVLGNDYVVYYYKKETKIEDGKTVEKEVRITEWANKGDSTAKGLGKVTDKDPVVFYAKWHSQLPDIKIQYLKDDNTPVDFTVNNIPITGVKYNDNLEIVKNALTNATKVLNGEMIDAKLTEDLMPKLPDITSNNIVFNCDNAWTYYNKVNDKYIAKFNKDLNDKTGEIEYLNLFANLNNKLDEGALDYVGTNERSVPEYVLTITPQFELEINITSPDDLKNLNSDLNNFYKQAKEATKADDKDKIEKSIKYFQFANINIMGDLNCNSITINPLFSNEYPFRGALNGLRNNDENYTISNLTIKNRENESYISIFGYLKGHAGIDDNAGTINNLVFDNIIVDFSGLVDVKSNNYQIAIIASALNQSATINGCTIQNTNINYTEEQDGKHIQGDLNIGLISAVSNTSLIKYIETNNCNINLAVIDGNITVGTIAGTAKGSSGESINNTSCGTSFKNNIKCNINATSDNGSINAGGLVGELLISGLMNINQYEGNINVISNRTCVGGLIGLIAKSKVYNCLASNITLNVKDNRLGNHQDGYDHTYVGGMIGRCIDCSIIIEKSYVQNSDIETQGIHIAVDEGQPVYASSMVGATNDNSNIQYAFCKDVQVDVKVFKKDSTEFADNIESVHIGYVYTPDQYNPRCNLTNVYFIYNEQMDNNGEIVDDYIKINNNKHTITRDDNLLSSNFGMVIDKMRSGIRTTTESFITYDNITNNLRLNDNYWTIKSDDANPDHLSPTLNFKRI